MDRVTFDFEKDLMIIENDEGTEEKYVPMLKRNREMIMLVPQSISIEDIPEMKEAWEDFTSGNIDEKELFEKSMEAIMDEVKSRNHEDLN